MADVAAFAALHRRGAPVVLPNAWDAASAAVFEAAGHPAIATSSAGVANALGFADGEQVEAGEMIAAIRRIARTVRVPVTADVEAGYAENTDAFVEIMRAVRDTGAVGVNLEDWDVRTGAPFRLETARARIAALKSALGSSLFVNARTDLYLHGVGDERMRFGATVARLQAYVAAGADGVFVPGIWDPEIIGALAAAVDAPLNILAGPSSPPVSELAALGVARISVGSGPHRVIMGITRAIADELLQGTFGFLRDPRAIPFAEANALFERDPAER